MRSILLSVSVFVLMAFSSSDKSINDCNAEGLSNACIPKLSTGFNFLKSYKIDGEGGSKNTIEYSYVFTKGTQYLINVCTADQNIDGIIVNLFDGERNKVASNKVENQLVSAIVYPSNTTGIFYIQYTFEGSSAFCGGSAMGFKR